jgi:hypothetical protein
MTRKFIQWSRAWFGRRILHQLGTTEKITVGLYDFRDNIVGEFSFLWIRQGLDDKTYAQLQVYEDAWATLTHFGRLLRELAKLNGTNPSPSRIVEMLKECGIEDATPEKRPST